MEFIKKSAIQISTTMRPIGPPMILGLSVVGGILTFSAVYMYTGLILITLASIIAAIIIIPQISNMTLMFIFTTSIIWNLGEMVLYKRAFGR